MSTQRSLTASPLKDRLLSNSPDPVQSSILRDSAKGWGRSSSPSSNLGTTPLRIAKREGKPPFPPVARRSSSSYKHVRNSNLVSKSPFKSQTPVPSRPSTSTSTSSDTFHVEQGTRRVSGEKRPRPDSMHEQAENERPLAFKRERRQSKAYQGLIEKEPVTKSPFKRVVSAEEEQPPPVPPKETFTSAPAPRLAPPSPPSSAPPSRPITPSRSSLVSKRLHGPRAADQPSLDGRRQRRKTVTFDERCDVLEFDRDEEENPFFSSDEDDYGEPEQHVELETHSSQGHDNAVGGDGAEQCSFESVQLGDADQSITGIVDNMLQSTSLAGLGLPSTPSRHPSLPVDMDTEDGVPYGRTHHAERARRRASVSSPAMSAPGFPFHDSEHSVQGSPSTPARMAEPSVDMSSGSDIPLGRSTHVERARQDHQVDAVEADVNMMPPSPSPTKELVRSEHSNRDALVPRFELEPPRNESSPKNSHSALPTADPFSGSKAKEDVSELSFVSFDDPVDPANLSIGQSEVSLSNLDLEAELRKVFNPPQSDNKGDVPRLSDLIPCNASFSTSTPPPFTPPLSFATSGSSNVSIADQVMQREGGPSSHGQSQPCSSPVPTPTGGIASRPASPSGVSRQHSSGSLTDLNMRRRSDSSLNLSSRLSGSPALSMWTGSPLRETASGQEFQIERMSRTRINREDVQMRLRRRSMESPLGSPTPGSPPPPAEPHAAEKVDGNITDEQSAVVPDVGESDQESERQLDLMSGIIDTSAEFATIQTAEKRTVNSVAVIASGQDNVVKHGEEDTMDGDALSAAADDNLSLSKPLMVEPFQPRPTPARPQSSLDMPETSFDLSGGLGMGLRDSMGSIQLGEMRSALDRLMDDVKGSSGSSTKKPNPRSQVRVELVTEGIKVGQFSANTSSNIGEDSMQTEVDMDPPIDDFRSAPFAGPTRTAPLPIQRATTDSVVYTGPSFRSPVDEVPVPASPTKDAIRAREQMILEKRRQARRRDEEESMGYYTPPRPTSMPPSSGRPSRRRSRSTGDAGALTKSDLLLDVGISETEEELLADSISKELRRLDPEHRQGKYRVREHEAIFASADAEQVSHMSFAGDVNSGKAWKAVRRPSDMNEYAKQIREYRSQEKPGKVHGKVFVRGTSLFFFRCVLPDPVLLLVLGVKSLRVPIPQQATALTCTLNNGIHFVTTPETRLAPDARIDQEFELIEHNKLEFTLTLKIRRDPHIVAQFKARAPPPAPAPQPVAPPPKPKGGMFSFLSSSPKKPPARSTPPPPLAPPHKLPDNLARYLKQDGTLARAFISFKDVAARCDTRLLEINYPLIGQRSEASGGATTTELGEIVLQMFRLPSLPGVLSNQLPLSLDECLRGLRHVAWHKVTYFEGTLTQNGGDCTTWRRRTFRVTGANLIAFNDVTKKATATINLKKAVAVEDTQDARSAALSSEGRYRGDYDSLIAVERSFRLVFPSDQEILFFADSDEEKARWLQVLRALVGHIPSNPLWAELVWQRQQETTGQSHPSSSTS
ncbi:hypothetical protein J3R82DRAFT_1503 [Butyriboletus roseoflavus]|nr:hypothetical protein J3R82DRAFT_1503 [Butyriboletus roseoflavus]